MHSAYKQQFNARVARQQAFFARKTPGDLLAYVNHWSRLPALDNYLMDLLAVESLATLRQPGRVREFVYSFVTECRSRYGEFYQLDDDMIPMHSEVFFAIGAVTAAMTGRNAVIDSHTTWCELALSWEEIAALRFNPDNAWVQFALELNKALWGVWEEDFLFLPYCHRSPLDAANGIRGTQLFEDLYDAPEHAHQLIEWCADWSISMEQFLSANVHRPAGVGRSIWGTWLPEGAIWVNGDPVGMINHDMQQQFEAPYTSKLFRTVGGGFFHHHAIGVHQVEQITTTDGILVQELFADPNVPHPAELIINDAEIRERFVRASQQVPIMLDCVPVELVDDLLPHIREGRFIIALLCADLAYAAEGCRKIRQASALNEC